MRYAMETMRVLVVAQSTLAQAGIGALVERTPDLTLLGAVTPEDLGAAIGDLEPDLVIVGVPAEEHGSAISDVLQMVPGLPVLVLVDHASEISAALARGAIAALPASAEPQMLRAAIDAATAGLVSLSRTDVEAMLATNSLGDQGTAATGDDLPVERLTPREDQVLQLLAAGCTNADIASRLGISEHTAKFHVGSVLAKLGARSRAEAVARAARLGWILV